uniref:NADPH oxidase 5 n=1 Tax=Aceria tosichella TaxID=561515 RepID=A0A6G1SM82_9ACAR
MSNSIAPFLNYISDEKSEEKLRDLFEFYDIDGNGSIQRNELIEVLSLCAAEIGLEVDTHLEQLADAVFNNAHLDQSGSITFEGLKGVLKARPNLSGELSLAKLVSYQTPSSSSNSHPTCTGLRNYLGDKWNLIISRLAHYMPIFNKLRWEYISNNCARFAFFAGICFISLLLIIARIITYWNLGGGFLIMARCSGQCLNFFSSIIVLLVCRRSISLLRAHGYSRYLPLDDHIYFHKIIGLFIVFHSFVHTIGHLLNFLQAAMEADSRFTYAEYLFSVNPGIGWLGGCASITGWLLLVIILIMSLAQPFSRSLGKFELFYYTHLLYIPFWVLLFVHAPRFWMWFLIPFTIFACESLIRLKNFITNLTKNGQTTIIKAVPLPSDVLHLVIKRPANFEYSPGDWIYVLVPQIAKYEWHPFTISSAPEQEGVIWLHIRAVGEWTRCLRSYFEGYEHRNHLRRFIRSGQFSMSIDQFSDTAITMMETSTPAMNKSYQPNNNRQQQNQETDMSVISDLSSVNNRTINSTKSMPNLTIFIDGPYGSPSGQIFRAEHAVLIATGIGVTPFASILQSIVHHYEKRRQKCPNCSHEFSDTRPPIVCKLRKVDFVWINRDQKSFEWFIKLLAELELTQSHLPANERFLDIHIHLTAMEPAKIKSIGLQLALFLVHEKNKKDLITGLRTRTKAGRPNWDEFFDNIREQKRGKVSVFFCGQPQLGRTLHRQCDSYGFKFRKEIF